MRIAIVGKGGSGKSSVSWLLTNFVAQEEGYVCAIDGDHNMDLTSLLGCSFDDNTPTFHRSHERFKEAVGQKEGDSWSSIVLDGRVLPTFSLQPNRDPFSQSLLVSEKDNIDLMSVGLGADDVLYSSKCAHGHSAPLKYYLPLLDVSNSHVLIDGVAGIDMLNAGMYTGADVVCIVVEPQPNSIRVCKQIRDLANKLNIPVGIIVNKTVDNNFLEEIKRDFEGAILGYLPVDLTILNSDFSSISNDTKEGVKDIWKKMTEKFSYKDTLPRLQEFQTNLLNKKTPAGT